VTIAANRVPRSEASAFGNHRGQRRTGNVVDFIEKPKTRRPCPTVPDESYASCNYEYVHHRWRCSRLLRADADDDNSVQRHGRAASCR